MALGLAMQDQWTDPSMAKRLLADGFSGTPSNQRDTVEHSPFMSSLNKQKFQRRPSLRNSVMLSGWTSIRANE